MENGEAETKEPAWRVAPHPTREGLLRQALKVSPQTATDAESRWAAKTLAREALEAHAMASLPDETLKTDDERRAAASRIVELMTGENDYDGRLWNGGKGFATGAEYLRSVRETLTRGMEAAMDPDLQAWLRMSDEEKDAKVDEEAGFAERIGAAFGDAAQGLGEAVRGVPRLSRDELAAAPEDVREADGMMGSVMWEQFGEDERRAMEKKVSDWRGDGYRRLKRRSEYEAKLRRKNALVYLPDMIRSLDADDAKALAGELAQDPERMPGNWTARLEALSTRDIETLAQIRGMTRRQEEGGFANWAYDVGASVYNGARGLGYGVFAAGEKVGAALWNKFASPGWEYDLNEQIERRHALWSAYAGWSSPAAAATDRHGAFADFTIGLAGAVPFVLSMKAKSIGYLACAGEMVANADAKAAAAGIDVTNPAYCARTALMGGLYAYCLKAVSPKFFGASANGAAEEMALRTAFMKGVLSGCANLDTLKVMSQRTASGALMMAMQQGIAAVNDSLNLGGDAWKEASERFTETFVSSIPDMLAFSAHGVLEGHARSSGGFRNMFTPEGQANRSQNLREAVENAFAVRAAVNGDKELNRRLDEIRNTQLATMAKTWTERGEKGLKELGLKADQIEEFKDFIEAERQRFGALDRQEAKLEELERATDAESLEEIDEDAPLAERNEAAKRYVETVAEIIRGRDRLFETLRDEAGAVRDLASVRNVWAQGHAVGAGAGDGVDAGAAALERAGFSKGDAAALSAAFGAERRGMYSPAAAEALRGLYTRSTRGQVEATAALAAAFGGRVRTVEGRTYLDFPMPDGGTGTLAVETVDLSAQFYGRGGDSMGPEVEKASGGAVKAAEWEKMTDAQRREAVEKHHLAVEGDFSVIDPSDPTLSVSAMDAERIVGRITLDPSADPGAAFHEAFHGFSRFCRETGFFDEADLKWLEGKYGKARQGEEQFDEETGAEGFRRYVALRLAGAITEEPSAWRKMFALVQRMRHLRERNAAVERIASNAEEALYDQLLAGRYAHIRDLKFTEPAAPKAETGAGTEVPQTGAKPSSAAGAAPEGLPSSAAGAAPEGKPSGALAKDGKPETPEIPETGKPPQPTANNPPPRVVRWEAQTPKGNKYVGGHYQIFKLSDLIHSNHPLYKAHEALQGRNRKDNKREEEQRGRIKAEFNGRRYLDNAVTSDGAPLVAMLPDENGAVRPFVISGNGRVMVLNELAESHLYDKYRNPLKEWAEKNGVENGVDDADNPVLVRVVDDLKGSNLLEVSRLSNVETTTPPTETELARTDAEHLRGLDLAKLYHANADGSPDMTPGVNDEFFRAFSHGPSGETIFDENRNVGETAQRRVMRAFLHLAVGDSPRGLAAAQKLITMSGTYGVDRQKGALQAMAPDVARTETNPDYAIGADVARAVADFMDFVEMKRAGRVGSLDEYAAQGDMFDQPSGIAADLTRTLAEAEGTARDMAERVKAYADIAQHSDADGALGGEGNARSREDVWREAGKLAEQRMVERKPPKTRFSVRSSPGEGGSIRAEKDAKDDEKKAVARVQPLEQGQNQPAHLRNGTTTHTLTLESAAPVRAFGNSISQDGVKSPANFLTGLVHALGSTETNPDKTQYFDITHEDGKNLSLRVANHRATAGQYREHGNTADVKTSIVVKMSDKPFVGSDDVELTEHVYFSDKLTAEREAAIASGVAEWIRTGEWHGPAADQVNMSPRRRFSVAGIFTGAAADYANRSRSVEHGHRIYSIELEKLEALAGMFKERTPRAANASGVPEGTADNIPNPADEIKRYSVVSLGGRDVAVAETEPLTTREAQDEAKVREVLMPIVGQEFPQLGEVKLVKIDGNFPDYFWNSNTSQNLRRVGKLWRAKVSAIPILGDILKTTPLGPKEAAEHLKKDPGFKDRAVFYRCTTEFGIKRHDGVAVYPCDLLVMEMTDNGNRYVYDIVRMKKPTLTAKADLSSETLSQLYERHLTGESATSVPEGTADNIPNPADEIKRYSVAYEPRSRVPAVRGGWNEKKILRYLKANPSLHGVHAAARLISEFDTVDELKDHMFYHGTKNYVGAMQPSMTKSERWAQEHGGGGYGQRYWGVSVSKSKKRASAFGNPSPGVSIYPVVLAKGAKVIDRPDLMDAADVEGHIVELWNDGVDAVRLGDWKSDSSEQELLVLNPRAICNIGTADSYRYFRLGSDENPLDIKDDAHIARMLEAAKDYADYSPAKRFGKPVRPSMFYPNGADGTLGEMKPREVIEAEKAQYEKDLAAWRESEQGIAAAEYEWKMRDAIRYSVAAMPSGEKFVLLDRPNKIDWNDRDKVREYLTTLVGTGAVSFADEKRIEIGNELPNEYTRSSYAEKAFRNMRLRKVRGKTAQHLDELIAVSGERTAEPSKHKKREGGVYYRRGVNFGVFGHEVKRGYSAELVTYEEGGREYLYDLVNIKDNPSLVPDSATGGNGGFEILSTYNGEGSVPEGTADNIPNPADEIKRDPEAFARKSIVSRMEHGSEDERESALVAFVAERALRHGPKPDAIKTIGRIGLELGLKAVDTGRIIKKGEALAERVRGTVIERAVKNGDAATAVALLARESDIDRAVDGVVAGAAEWGGKLTEAGKGRIKSILEREIEKTVRSFNAASLADVERDTGIDIAGEILANSPEKFDPSSARRASEGKPNGAEVEGDDGSASAGSPADEANLSDYEIARRQRVRKEAEERVAKMIATAKERTEKAKKEREAWEQRREERKRRAEESAAGNGETGTGGGEAGEGSVPGAAAPDRPKLSTFADFKSPEEFAAFFRVWAEDRYKKEHGTSTLGKHEEKRLFPEFYRKAAVRELQDLADKLLPPKGARATVNRWLGEIQPGVKPDTLERISADVFAYINKNAIRESRTAQIQKFRNGLQKFVKGPQFDDLKMDADRKVTGWVEEAARYIRRVCNLSIRSINGEQSQLEQERERLQAILDRREKVYDDEGKNAADAPKFDMETRRALAKLQLLEKYGAMKRYMPGEIADLADEAMRWLKDEAVKLEDAWREARETEDQIRGALTAGIVGPNGQRYQKGKGAGAWFDGLFDSLNGMIRLRLQHLVRFADSKAQQRAKEAINRVVVMLGDGEVAFARHLQDDRAAFHKALAQIFATPDGKGVDRRALADWLNRMTEAIPKELSAKLSKQGYADSMTYGQMLQLLVSLEQRSYAEAIKTNGRDGQAALIRTFETVGADGRRERVLTDKDILFIDWLRSFYEAKRGLLSSVTRRMVGLDIDSPDPLYCPVKMYMGDKARGLHADSSAAWDPIGAVFSRRVANVVRDFDESASILGQFFDRSAASANLVAWGERGSVIRGVFTDAGVQESIRRAFGGGELTKILRQLEETFNGGENIRKSPGEIAAADKAMNWMTYLSLGYNPLSAAKQTTSFTVWANALPGGFKDLWRYMTDVDMATIKHIKESEAFRVRYGNEVGSGHDVASKGLFENPSENPVAAFFRKTSMGLLRKGDFLPGGWIAQGLFRDLYNRHLKEGMDADAADRLAMTETFNMLEETQQSGRTYNTSALAREHGRLGRLLVQFATSPLQQLQYETQALREVQDLKRYRPPAPDADYEKRLSDAKGKLVRAAVINHVLLPAALHVVTNLYRLAMGHDPEWEQEGWHFSLFRDVMLGQASRIFFLGTLTSTLFEAMTTGKVSFRGANLLPIEGSVEMVGRIGKTAHDIGMGTWNGVTAKDFANGFDYEKVQKDLHGLLRSTSITRTPYDVIRRLTGHSDADEKKRKEGK